MSILDVTNLRKEYPSFLLDDISFSLQEGQITGFIGRNGAGKSPFCVERITERHRVSGHGGRGASPHSRVGHRLAARPRV